MTRRPIIKFDDETRDRGLFHYDRRSESNPARVHNNNNNNNNNDGGGSGDNDSRLDRRDGISLFYFFIFFFFHSAASQPFTITLAFSVFLSLSLSLSLYPPRRAKEPRFLSFRFLSFLPSAPRPLPFFLSLSLHSVHPLRHSPPAPGTRALNTGERETRRRTHAHALHLPRASTFDPAPDMRR